jgi:hypothetical protein
MQMQLFLGIGSNSIDFINNTLFHRKYQEFLLGKKGFERFQINKTFYLKKQEFESVRSAVPPISLDSAT